MKSFHGIASTPLGLGRKKRGEDSGAILWKDFILARPPHNEGGEAKEGVERSVTCAKWRRQCRGKGGRERGSVISPSGLLTVIQGKRRNKRIVRLLGQGCMGARCTGRNRERGRLEIPVFQFPHKKKGGGGAANQHIITSIRSFDGEGKKRIKI